MDDRLNAEPVSNWWPDHLADAERRLKPSTVRYYVEAYETHVLPEFGGVAVGKIRPSSVDRWIAKMLDAGVSPSRTRGAAGVLSRLLEAAVRDRAILSNPCAVVSARIPATPKADRPVLDPAEVARLHQAAYGVDDKGNEFGHPHLPVLVSILAWGGLRIGEALALQRHDIDLTAGTVLVRRSVSDIRGVVHITGTKTGKDRTVTLPASVVAEVKTHMATLPINPDAWLFPSKRVTGPRRYTNFRRDLWAGMRERYDTDRVERELDPVEVTPHDLRSSCASLLIDAGASVKDVQAHLGHADISTTLNLYARVKPGRAADLAARMDKLLTGATN
jgi:integrase